MRTCQETSGFLFKHACSNPAEETCDDCGKEVCSLHCHYWEGNQARLCTSCYKKRNRDLPKEQRDYGDDPHFYGDRYYRGYGRYHHGYWGAHYYAQDRNDFSEGDAAILGDEGDADYENDFDAS